MMTGDDESGSKPTWSREEDKAFENALVAHPEDLEDRWEKIAADVPGKSVEEIKHHYEMLVDDVKLIESGCFPLPCYNSSSPDGSCDDDGGKKGGGGSGDSDSVHRGKSSAKSDQERRKGIAWTEDEHKLFLLGLDKYGKGDWRSISRNFVVTRTPTQVASHAQKYFIRLNSINKDRRRTSIHDITSVDNGDISVPQSPITGGSSAGSKQPSQATPPPAIGQPVGVAGGPAIGTPVNLPPSTIPHMGYGIGAPVPGQAVPGPLMNGKYPMSHTPSLR